MFRLYFIRYGKSPKPLSWTPDGRLNVDGEVESAQYEFPDDKFPISFGIVTGDFNVSSLGLTSLEGCPETVGGTCYIASNKIKDLRGGPKKVNELYMTDLPLLESLEGFPEEIVKVQLTWSSQMPLLRLLRAKEIVFDNKNNDSLAVHKILQQYAGQGKMALFDCQKDLEDAGYPGNAKW